MNNLQHIIKDDTRAAMHVAVELCERGDFDSVTEAFRWLMREREDDTLGSDEANVDECKRIILEGKKQLTAAEQHIEQLESLVRHLWHLINHRSGYGYASALESIEELGIEVDE